MSKMSNAPVYYAMAQVHFAPIAVENYVSLFHDAVRTKFPFKRPKEIRRLEVTNSGATLINDSTLWLLTANNEYSGLIVDDSTLTYHTTQYDRKSPFIEELMEALGYLHDIAKLGHISRLGMRYLDAIFPEASQSLNDYLVESVRGFSELQFERSQAMSESIFRTKCGPLVEEGTLVSRVYQLNGNLEFPPELSTATVGNLKLLDQFEKQEAAHHAIIDTDHFVEGALPVDLNGTKEQLNSLHAGCSEVFKAVTTKFAEEYWK